jgi:hypothetical protein
LNHGKDNYDEEVPFENGNNSSRGYDEELEIKFYLTEMKIGAEDSALEWWNKRRKTYSILFRFSNRYLSTPITSTEIDIFKL